MIKGKRKKYKERQKRETRKLRSIEARENICYILRQFSRCFMTRTAKASRVKKIEKKH